MGAIIPPAPLILLLQFAIVAYVPIIPLVCAVIIVRSARHCVLRRKPIQSAIREAYFNILVAVAAPLGVSIFLWIAFFAQAAFVFSLISFYLIIKPLRKYLSKQWLLHPTSNAAYPLMWYDTIYEYCPLETEHEIRLLVLFPGLLHDTLRGDIIGTDLRWKPTYDALSYTWADESGDASRWRGIHCVSNDTKIYITSNCEAALRRLRHPTKQRRLWVDSICINQDSDAERSHQVSLMSDIYRNARHVIAYTGEGTSRTDLLYDWLNGVDVANLNIPPLGLFKDINVSENSILRWPAYIWNTPEGAKDRANEVAIAFERYWRLGCENLSTAFRGRPLIKNKIDLPEAELDDLVNEYLSRRWFKRVWVLQEVSLPELRKIRIVCGSKTTTAEKALHLLSLLKTRGSSRAAWVFIFLRRRIAGPKTSYLLDILIETSYRECSDPRDKIFGILSIAHWMDDGKFPQLKADYQDLTPAVYWNFSAFFIQHHGAGFFLALIKSPRRLQHLPSWAGDWTAPWPNHNAVRGIDFPGRSRIANSEDSGGIVRVENGKPVLSLLRRRIRRGFFTRDGHIDGSTSTHIEDVQSLGEKEVLIEMYPGLAALLMEDGEYYVFIQVCPHALEKIEVDWLVGRWSRVVVFMEGLGQSRSGKEEKGYLSEPEIFEIW